MYSYPSSAYSSSAYPGTTPGMAAGVFSLPGEVRVILPVKEAKVKLNGVEMGGGGYDRRLAVTIRSGEAQKYTVTATWPRGGQTVTEVRTVQLTPFQRRGLANFFVPQE